MAYTGTLGSLHPPTNNGTHNGSAFIDGNDGSFQVAQTPRDNNGEILTAGSVIYYTLTADGNHIESISHTNPDDGTGGVGGIGTP